MIPRGFITAKTYGLTGPIGSHEPQGSLARWRHELESEDLLQRRANWICLAVGVAMQVLVLITCLFIAHVQADYSDIPAAQLLRGAAIMAVSTSFIGLGIAVITKPAGRGETAGFILDHGLQGNRSGGGAGWWASAGSSC